MRLSQMLMLSLLLVANSAIAQTTTYDSTQKVDTNNTSTSTSTITSTNNNNNVNSTTSTATTNNTNTSTNTNYNVNSGTQTINNNNSISSTSTSTNVNTNNNINSGDMTVRNINTGDMTNRNINTTTSNNTNTNNNINTGDMTNRNINTTTSTSVNTNNNINSGTQTFNNNNISSSTAVNTNNNVNSSTSSNVNTNIQQGEMTNRNINETRMRVEQPPPTAIAPAMMSGGNNDLCTTGTSGAVQTQILGVSSGGTVRDLNCERLKNAKTLYDMGMKVAAVATMCQDRRVFDAMWHAGTPCPYEGTIGEQARVAWLANPDKMPKSEEPKGDDFYKKTGFGAVLGAVLLSLVR